MANVAVAMFHGIGSHPPTFALPMARQLECRKSTSADSPAEIVCRSVLWGPVLQDEQDQMVRQINENGKLKWSGLRELVIDSLGDAISYHPSTNTRVQYDAVHLQVAEQLFALGETVGHDAILCVVAHSFGSVIASNYFYDWQRDDRATQPTSSVSRELCERFAASPLTQGKTLAMFITLGSPLALWSLRQGDFDRPIDIPGPTFRSQYPNFDGGWFNFYDPDDVLAYPLSGVSDAYATLVSDIPVRVGSLLTGWNPLSHCQYWHNRSVIQYVSVAIKHLTRHITQQERVA